MKVPLGFFGHFFEVPDTILRKKVIKSKDFILDYMIISVLVEVKIFSFKGY